MRKYSIGFLILIVGLGTVFVFGLFIFLPPVVNDNDGDQANDQDDLPYWYYVTDWERSNDTSVFDSSNVIKIDNITYFIEGSVLRDFMPIITPTKDTGLQVSVSVVTNASFPSNMDVDALWVKHFDSIFTTTAFKWEERLERRINKAAGGGPGWQEGVIIDIAVRLISDSNQTHYLVSRNHELIYTF